MRAAVRVLVIVIVTLFILTFALSIPIIAYTTTTIDPVSGTSSSEKALICLADALIAVPVGMATYIGTGTSEKDPRVAERTVIEIAVAWTYRGVGVVPVSRTLVETLDSKTGTSKFAPIPTIRWQKDGPLRSAEHVRAHWSKHPDDQLGIVLENPELKLVCCDVDLKKLPGGIAPEGRPIPRPFGGEYVERSKSDGRHYLAAYTTSIPEWVGGRWTSLGGYVDVLARGILFCAPSHFVKPDGKDGGECTVLVDGPVPTFSAIGEPIARWADWLYPAWRCASERGESPAGEAEVVARKVAPAVTVTEILARMRKASDAGKIVAWICERTDGESRDWDLCPKLVVHALEAGASADQAAEIVGCPYWPEEKVEAIKLTRAAGIQSLLKHTEGKAAYAALRDETSSPLARRLRRYAGLPCRSARDILGEGP